MTLSGSDGSFIVFDPRVFEPDTSRPTTVAPTTLRHAFDYRQSGRPYEASSHGLQIALRQSNRAGEQDGLWRLHTPGLQRSGSLSGRASDGVRRAAVHLAAVEHG